MDDGNDFTVSKYYCYWIIYLKMVKLVNCILYFTSKKRLQWHMRHTCVTYKWHMPMKKIKMHTLKSKILLTYLPSSLTQCRDNHSSWFHISTFHLPAPVSGTRIYQFLFLLWVVMTHRGPDGNLESPVRLTILEDVTVVIILAMLRRYI